jgi:hypothetical protein
MEESRIRRFSWLDRLVVCKVQPSIPQLYNIFQMIAILRKHFSDRIL